MTGGTARIARLDMTAECAGAASEDGAPGFGLFAAERMRGTIVGPTTKDGGSTPARPTSGHAAAQAVVR